MDGFYSGAEVARVRTPLTMVPACGTCGLWEAGCKTPKMKPAGKGRKEILIVSSYPGRDEDRGRTDGNSTRQLAESLRRVGVDLHEDCLLTYAARCYPGQTSLPKKVIEHCRPNLLKTIQETEPRVVVLLGDMALKSLVGHVWKEDVGGISRWTGWRIPLQKFNCWVCPTHHPVSLLKEEDPVLDREYLSHLKAAVQLKGRPWDEVPDYESRVELVYDAAEASDRILGMIGNTPIAYDFETTTLKPDGPHAEIVCCSMSSGDVTIAFPWGRGILKAFREFVRSDTPKIASNLDMENRWTRRFLRCAVKNWHHDTMLDAHALDPRGKISGLKFQAFVRLGVSEWDSHVSPYLKSSKGGNAPNRIREVPMDQLLQYCGLDSLYEWLVADTQRKIE